jgi:DNA-binding NarL/FixJ family response regulator
MPSRLGPNAARSRFADGTALARILIVDDSALERTIFARIATALGHEIVGEAPDLEAALRIVEHLAPSLIVLDGRLPGGGLAAIGPLLGASPAARLAVIAAIGELDLVRAARERGASGALRRPLLASQVATALEELARP